MRWSDPWRRAEAAERHGEAVGESADAAVGKSDRYAIPALRQQAHAMGEKVDGRLSVLFREVDALGRTRAARDGERGDGLNRALRQR